MIPSVLNPSDDVMVGNDSGWLLSFCNEAGDVILEVGRDDYYAEIEATLPGGLEGGEYQFAIEGLTDEDYGKIAKTEDNEEKAAFVDLYLFWRDTASSVTGYVKNLTGLTDLMGGLKSEELADFKVASLSVSKVSRKKGKRRYEAHITAKERVFAIASSRKVCGEVSADQPVQLASTLAEQANIEVVTHDMEAFNPPPEEGTSLCAPERGRTLADTLKYLAKKMAQGSNLHGRGMLLIRDGVLHIGKRRIPLENDSVLPLHTGTGLLKINADKSVKTDPNFDICAPENADASDPNKVPSAPSRKQFKLILKGRADIKPGCVVEFMPPEGEMDKAGGHWTGALGETAMAAVGGSFLPSLGLGEMNPKKKIVLYVHSVNHKLGRASGFVTTITGVKVELPDNAWDRHSPKRQPETEEDEPEQATASARAARACRRLVRRENTSRQTTEIGEVRQANTVASQEPPAQTTTLWRGLVSADGGVNQTRRLDVQRPTVSQADGAPYLTPFAFGKAGLVLPRYPGTRVAIAHRHSDRGEPLDIGAMWKSGNAPDSQAGDWWLSLPSEVPSSERESVTGQDPVDTYGGKVSNDLIDADGNRIMEVAGFTLRFHADGLQNAGTRPSDPPEPDAVTIEHSDGSSKIVMKSNGEIEIKGEQITMDAGGGDIIMKAGAVKVE